MAHLPISQDVYLELPTEPVLQSLGTNYNALVRTWTLRQYQLHLEHHQKMVHYYQQCIKRVEELEIKYEREPEQTPIAAVGAGGPIKLSDLAKMKPQQSAQPLRSPTPVQSHQPTGPAANIKSFDGGKSNTLSSSLAAKDVKLDKKPKPMTVNVHMDADEVDALTGPELEHFSRPQPKRKNNKRTDIPKLDDQPEEDEVSTWQETPNAFTSGDKKESKFKSTFGNLKSSLFNKDEKEKPAQTAQTTQTTQTASNNISISTNTPSSPTNYPPPPSAPSTPSYGGGVPPVYNPSTNYSSFNSPSSSSNPPPTMPSAGPPMPSSGPPMPSSGGPAMPSAGPPKMPSAPPPMGTLGGSSGYKPPPPPPTP